MKIVCVVFLLLPLLSLSAANTTEFEFLEAFAWGDREAALKELVPDTEDYYYYHCLHYQLINDRVAFQRTLDDWLKHNKNRWNSRMKEMQRRQMLLQYTHNPAQTWDYIREDNRLYFNHRPRREQRSPTYPSVLRPEQYSMDVFLKEARRRSGGLLDNVTPRGLELVTEQLGNPDIRRSYLGQLQRPDVPGLVDLIVADLRYKDSRGFGHHTIHRLLTRAQLETLGEQQPDLLRDQHYIIERLSRIQPPDVDLTHDHEAAVEYYQEMWTFVRTLSPIHNSLKASTLYRLLDHQRQMGEYNEALFKDYLALPRAVSYLDRDLRDQLQRQRVEWVNFGYQPGRSIVLPPIGSEEPLVRDFLIRLLRDDSTMKPYAPLFEADWLRAIFAESKILNGVGKPEDWAHLLSPQAYRNILERIELNIAPENPAYLSPGDAVALKVDVKRVESLLIKIYEMQTFNYYSTYQAPVDQAVDLDGMIPTHERTLDVASDPGRRVRHSLALPEINHRGVYVVELIGNGVSSRALLHVGNLESISQATAAGQVMMILNDAGETVKNSAVWMNGREFISNEQGLILLPYSENPGVRFAVLKDGDFCSPEQFQHLGESYSFKAGIHIDPQTLNRRSTGLMVLRPDLRIQGIPLDLSLLKDVKVTLAATDAKGTRSEREYTAEFDQHTEWAREFYVPDGLRTLEVMVEARIKRKTDLEVITLNDRYVLPVNHGRSGDVLKQVFLTPHAQGWALEVRGLNGEPIVDEPLRVYVYHPGFKRNVDLSVTTDEAGRVALGSLKGLERIRVSGSNLELDLPLSGGASVYPDRLHVQPGEEISLPYPYDRDADLRTVSLFEKGRGLNLRDVRDQVTIADGQLQVAGLTEGEYELTLHEAGVSVTLEVLNGEARSGFILGKTKRLQQTGTELPSVASIERGAEEVSVQLRNATMSTRVAVRAYRYAGAGSEFPLGQGFAPPSQRRVYPPHAQYISGRNIGDEYRYVLERKFQKIFAGTLLERPGLILNPWMLRETTAEQEQLKQDQAYRGGRQRMNAPAEMMMEDTDGTAMLKSKLRGSSVGGMGYDAFGGGGGGSFAPPVGTDIGFDFLPHGSRWWVNLTPGKDGKIRIPLKELDEQTALEIVVIDRFGTTLSRQPLPYRSFEPKEVRLRVGLDPSQNFSRQKNVRRIEAAKPVVFPDFATTRYQVIGDFSQAFDLLQTLSGEATLQSFSFLKTWPDLDKETKMEKYGEFASHELHLFLYKRDRAFFDQVVKPYLQNKKDKTFVDRWLLDALLPEDTRIDHLQDRNALELALLARRGGDRSAMQAALREAGELNPPDPEGFARRVQVALQANELDEVSSLARDAAKKESENSSESVRRMQSTDSKQLPGRTMADMSSKGQLVPASAPAPSVSFTRAEGRMESNVGEELDTLMELSMDDLEAIAGENVRLYRALPKTKEWAEQNYYNLRVQQDVPGRLPVNDFWQDVAAGVELSPHLLQSHRNLTDVLVSLAFSGLPFSAEAPVEEPKGAHMTLTVAQPAILVSEQILPAEASEDDRPLLLSQQFFRPDDMYRYEDNERIEKFISGEFIRHTVYGARVTLTNPTASRRRLNVLLQIPLGAIPLRNGFYTDDQPILLEPYTTRTVEYFFSFPASGTFEQFPAHASAKEAIIGQAEPRVFDVKDAPTEVDKTSWAWISHYGSNEDTLNYLKTHNLRRLDLNEMAWRLKDKTFYKQALGLLTDRGLFHDTSYSYGIFHQEPEVARVWLANSPMARTVGPVLDSPLLVVDPVETKSYEHLEYDPLVNPRAHDVGEKRKILNFALREQYRSFLFNNLYRDPLGAHEQLVLVYYLQLQDRLAEAGEQLALVEEGDVHENLQTTYLKAWMALRNLETDKALALAKPFEDDPIPRWGNRFSALVRAIEEARGADVAETEDPTRQQDLNQMAAREPAIELETVSGELQMTTHNLEEVTMNLYPMDIELLFSRKPFLAEGGADFAVIKPALTRTVNVKGKGEEEKLTLPPEYRDRNLMVELTGKGQRASVAWYANNLNVRKMVSYGQVEVRASSNNRPLPKTYVKVFARGADGRESFWKDGYTDLRGRFDYLSLNDRQPEEAVEFSILILHPELGAEITQAEPPTR